MRSDQSDHAATDGRCQVLRATRGRSVARAYLDRATAVIESLDPAMIERVVDRLLDAYSHGRRVFVIGNGGSAATASHMACDLANNVVAPPHCRLRVTSLSENVSAVSALANDRGYEHVFVDQLMCLAEPGDVLIAISGSGDSENVVAAMAHAKSAGLAVVGLLGRGGGRALKLTDEAVLVPDGDYGHIEDAHLMVHHAVVATLRAMLAGPPGA